MKKKNVWYISVTLLTSLVIVIFFFINNNRLKISISDVKIDEDEYINTMNNKKYDVTQYFIEKYGAKITNDFWEQEFGGEYPYKMLADSTIDELKVNHSIYEVAKEKGYVDSVEYKDFVKRLNNENEIREENIQNGKVVYGLSKFTEDLFLEYETDKIQKSYCNDSNNEGMEISLEDSKSYYDENKDTLFVKNDDLELYYIKVYYSVLELSEEEVSDIKDSMIEVSRKIDDNNSLLSLVENEEILKDYFTHESILSAEVSVKARTIGDVLDIAFDLEKGDITQVLDQNECLYLIQCIDRVNYDYIPYEEVRDNINKVLREEHYDDIIANIAKSIQVNTDMKKVYNFTKKNVK
jgi:hypothetical protein